MTHIESFLGKSETTVRTSLAVGTLVAGVVYGLAYYGVSLFYGRFRLRPEDVGLTQGSIIPRALVILGFFLLLTAELTLYGSLGWLFVDWINYWIARPADRALVWLINRISGRPLQEDPWLGWPGAALLALLLLLSTVAVGRVLGWGALVLIPIVALPLGAALHNSLTTASDERIRLLSVVGLIVVVGLFIGSYYVISDGANRLSESLATNGHLETGEGIDSWLANGLGLRGAQVQADGLACAVLLGTNGDNVWVLEQITTDQRTTTAVRSVSAESARIWPLSRGTAPRCWKH